MREEDRRLTDKIINFPGVEREIDGNGLNAKEMLTQISEEDLLESAIVLGWTKDNNLFVATSGESGPEIMFLLEISKSVIISRCLSPDI